MPFDLQYLFDVNDNTDNDKHEIIEDKKKKALRHRRRLARELISLEKKHAPKLAAVKDTLRRDHHNQQSIGKNEYNSREARTMFC